MKAAVAFLAAVLLLAPALADEDVARAIAQSRRFIEQHPVQSTDATPADLVNLWQQLVDVDRMVWLMSRKALPLDLQPELYRRISANQLRIGVDLRGHGDPLVRGLAGLVHLHADVASQHLEGRVSESAYADVTAYALTHGHELARLVEKKHAKGRKILRDTPAATRW